MHNESDEQEGRLYLHLPDSEMRRIAEDAIAPYLKLLANDLGGHFALVAEGNVLDIFRRIFSQFNDKSELQSSRDQGRNSPIAQSTHKKLNDQSKRWTTQDIDWMAGQATQYYRANAATKLNLALFELIGEAVEVASAKEDRQEALQTFQRVFLRPSVERLKSLPFCRARKNPTQTLFPVLSLTKSPRDYYYTHSMIKRCRG
jgi:hypothetical protein